MFGTVGNRVGNFIVQNADLLICLGARLSFKQIGFNYEMFAPKAKKIVIDVDPLELKKPTIRISIPICADVFDVISALSEKELHSTGIERNKWFDYCCFLKNRFYNEHPSERESISAYNFADIFFSQIDQSTVTVLGNNTSAVSILQSGIKKRGQRLYGNVNCGTMGYDLPASIGAAVAVGKPVFLITGEGSLQMNIQELQTIVHNSLPVKIVVFNNNSYQAIVQTQKSFFNAEFAGCTKDSGISFPSFAKLAYCYGLPFKSICKNVEIPLAISWLIQQGGAAMLELIQTEPDPIIPKLSSKKLEDGDMVSPPIDDLFPFLTLEEYSICQYENFAWR